MLPPNSYVFADPPENGLPGRLTIAVGSGVARATVSIRWPEGGAREALRLLARAVGEVIIQTQSAREAET